VGLLSQLALLASGVTLLDPTRTHIE
jgi:hypothetical protein